MCGTYQLLCGEALPAYCPGTIFETGRFSYQQRKKNLTQRRKAAKVKTED
jgi:translation initiation factor IF-3